MIHIDTCLEKILKLLKEIVKLLKEIRDSLDNRDCEEEAINIVVKGEEDWENGLF